MMLLTDNSHPLNLKGAYISSACATKIPIAKFTLDYRKSSMTEHWFVSVMLQIVVLKNKKWTYRVNSSVNCV